MQNDTRTLEETLVEKFKKMKISDRIVEMAAAKIKLEDVPPGMENEQIRQARLTVKLLSLPDEALLAL
ncbi:MAG: hypothetical protein DYH13_02740 [Alphaproteobacteria bacterium PRO2]|nr:hypothetical protein [Alphaproteobacteria bacterium PRO2]